MILPCQPWLHLITLSPSRLLTGSPFVPINNTSISSACCDGPTNIPIRLPVEAIYGSRRKKTCLRGFAINKAADQSVHPHSLIRAWIVRLLERIKSKLATIKISLFYLVSAAERHVWVSFCQKPQRQVLSCRGPYASRHWNKNKRQFVKRQQKHTEIRPYHSVGGKYRGSYMSASLVADIEDLAWVRVLLQVQMILHKCFYCCKT